jgi:hypothetical protein
LPGPRSVGGVACRRHFFVSKLVPAIDDYKRVSEPRLLQSARNRGDQTLADPPDVVLRPPIADDWQFLPELGSRASAQLDVLGHGESILVGIDARLRVGQPR